MNHTYRLVFSTAMGTCVPAPETAKGAGKGRSAGMRAGELRADGIPLTITRTALALALAAALPAQAQTWVGATGDYHATGNWNPATVPSTQAATAVYGNTGATNVAITSDVQVGTFQFDASAPAYTIGITDATLQFYGSGIVNNAPASPVINISRAGASNGSLQFLNNATAGNATIHSTGANINLAGNATLGNATVHSTGANVNFNANSTGGTATIHADTFVNVTGTSNLQSATVDMSAGMLRFATTGSGGGAAVLLGSTARLGFFNYAAAGTTIGSLSGSGTVNLVDTGTVAAAKQLAIGGNDQSTTFSGAIQGAGGSIVKEGTGTLTLTGNNSFSGGLTINAGTLQVGAGGITGTLGSGTVTTNASLVFNRSNTYNVSNAIGGTGALTQAGSGTLVLQSLNNTYSGGTRIQSGEIEIGNGSALGTGEITMAGGRLRTSTSVTLANDIRFESGTTSTLAAENAFSLTATGATTVEAGAVARFGSVGARGEIRLDGATTVQGTIDLNGGVDARILDLSGTGTIANTGVFADLTLADGNFGGSITGDINVKQQGGMLTLSGNNSYTGTTSIDDGTLRAGTANVLPAGTAVTISGLGVLDLTGGNQTIASLAGNSAGATVALGSRTLTTGGNNANTAYAGAITGVGGKLVKQGTGTLTLGGFASTFTGGTTINEGTISIGNAQALGTGTITFNGGQLATTASMQMANQVDFAAGGTGNITAAAGTSLSLDGPVNLGANAVATFGTSGVASTVTLDNTGTADPTARLRVAGGTLGGGAALGAITASAQDTTVDAGATLDFGGTNAQIRNLQGLGTVQTGAGYVVLHEADFGGVIDGTGGLRKATTGTAILSGQNTYSGGTLVQQGVLQVGNGGATGMLGAGDVTIGVGATLDFNRNDTAIVGNLIAGNAGSTLRQSGTGTTVLTGNSSFNGTVDIDAGTLQLGNGGTTGTLGTGQINNNSALVFNRSDAQTVGNAISGSGTVGKAGSGTTILTGTNSYAGTTTIASGTLQVGGGGTTGTLGTGAVANNGSLVFDRSDTHTVANAISGSGTVGQAGSGTTILTADNAYTGGTTIVSGTLQVGNGSTTGTLGTGAVTNNSQLRFDRSGVFSVGNTISGTGSLEKAGSGTMLLTADSNYAGTTTISGGVLQVGGGGSTGSLGSGAVVNNGQLGFNRTGTVTVNAISGTGLLYQGGQGTVVLAADNSYAGTTTVFSGTLQVGNGGTTGSLGTGAVTNDGHLRFDRSNMFVVANTISGTGSLEKAGTGSMLLSADNDYSGTTTISGGTLQVGGGGSTGSLGTGAIVNNGSLSFLRSGTLSVNAISGTGSLYQGGTGTVVLAADNSYAGTTTVSQGTLQVGNGGTTGTLGTGSVAIENLGTLAFNRSDFHAVANDISTGTVGHLRHQGTGMLVLSGNNSYTDTLIDSGTLVVGAGGTTGTLGTGNVTNNGTLAFARSNDLTVVNAIDGAGSMRQAGGGRTTLTGNNGYTGTTTVESGVLQVGAGGTTGSLGTGAVQNDAALVFDRSDDVTVGNAINGAGSLEQAGTGRLTLTGVNNYAGGTLVSRGVLQVGAGGTSGALGSGAVTNNGALVFDRSDDVTVGNAIGGSGSLEQAGGGRLTLTGANSYGATLISAGTLQVGNGGTTGSLGSGNVTNNGALAFNRSDTVSLANVISGTGSLTQSGSGNLVLTGANTYTGGTFVNAGTLSVNGSIVGNTTVNNGGTLGGTGTVGSVTVNSGGTLAPGNSIGTLTAAGNLAFAPGSVYRVEANAAGAADRVDAVGAGTITINGGTVDVQASGAGYQRNTAYTILSSGGATTGQFDSVTSNLAFLTPTLIYSANGVALNLQASDALNYASAARTPNQAAVANYLQGIANTPGAAAALIQQIDNMTADQASASFESMAGSAHASASQVAGALGRNFSATLASRSGFSTGGLGNAMNDWSQVRYASLAPVETSLASSQERGLWAQALGAGGRVDADGNAAGSRYRNSGLVLGYDQPVTGQWLAGGAVGYSTSWWNATSGDPSSGKIESPQAGLYARYTSDSFRVRLDGTFSSHDFTTDRTVNLAGVGATANSKHKGREWGLAGQVEMPIKAGAWEVRPLAGLRYAHLNEDGFSETGQSPANLAVAERTTQNTLLSAGMHFVRPFNQGKAGLELRAVASHLAGDNDSPVTASLIGQPGSFTAAGVPLKRNALTLGTTVSGQFTRNVSAYLDANYEVRGSGQNAYQFTGGMRVSF